MFDVCVFVKNYEDAAKRDLGPKDQLVRSKLSEEIEQNTGMVAKSAQNYMTIVDHLFKDKVVWDLCIEVNNSEQRHCFRYDILGTKQFKQMEVEAKLSTIQRLRYNADDHWTRLTPCKFFQYEIIPLLLQLRYNVYAAITTKQRFLQKVSTIQRCCQIILTFREIVETWAKDNPVHAGKFLATINKRLDVVYHRINIGSTRFSNIVFFI